MSSIRDPAYITDTGQTMMTAGGDITYTKAVLYGQDISNLRTDQIKALTTIGNPLRETQMGVSGKKDTDGHTTVILEATFQNNNLKADLPYTAVGFFARKDDKEKLVAVAVANKGTYLAATSPDGVATDALDLKLAITIGDTANVTTMIDPAGSVTPATLNGTIDKVTQSLTAKIDTKADSEATQKALDKKANKADVEASLATKANSTDLDKTNAEVAKKANSDDVKAQIDGVSKSISDVSDTVKANKDATDQALATKADKTDVAKDIDTVNKSISSMSATITANQKATDTALDTKADKTTVNQELATKANSSDVDKKLDEKADKSSVDAKINAIDFSKIKFRKQYVNSDGQPADKTWSATKNKDGTYTIDLWYDDWTASKLVDVLAQLPNKVDTSTVNAQIADTKNAIKSNTDKLQSAINTKANASDVADNVKTLQANIDTKADKATIDAEIAKIDFTPYAKSADVAKDLQGYTTTADLTKLLAGKRDIADSYSRDELDKKFLQLSTDTSGKVSADQIAKLLASKVDKTDLTSQLQAITDSIGTKANSANVTAELAKKDNTADVDAKIKTVTDLANTKANASDVYNKSAVDTAFSQRDSRITNVTNLANQIDSTRLPLYQGSANEDLKGFFTPQIRMYNNATGVKNIPADCQYQSNFYGTLVVLPDGASNTNDGSQILITPERKAWIAQSNGQGAKSWSDWSRFTLTSDLSAVQSALQAKIDAKADASNVYSKSEVDSKTTATIVTGYDIPSKTKQTMSASVNVRWFVAPAVIDIVADQINQLKGRRTIDTPDFNSLTDGGSYYITNPQGGKNGPTGSWGNLFVSNGNGHRISQLYFPDDGSAPFMRELDESTWHNWIQLSTKQDVNNATNAANAASNKIDTVLANSYVRKQGMNANGECAEIKHTGIKQANGGYAFDMWSDDWTASKLRDVIKNQLPSKANTADVNNALNDKANAGDVSALQNKVNVNTPLFREISADSTWEDIFGVTNPNNVLTSLRINPGGSGQLVNDFAAGIGFGGNDTKAVITVDYGSHVARFTAGNGTAPGWSEDVAWKSDINSTNQTVSALQQTIKTLNDTLSSANDTIKTLQDTVTKQATQITGLQTLVNSQAQDIAYIKANYIEGKRFSKADESQATAWEKENSQRIAFITDN